MMSKYMFPYKRPRGRLRDLVKKGDRMDRLKRILVAVTLMVTLVVPSFAFAEDDVDSPVGGSGMVFAEESAKDYNGKKPCFWVYIIKPGEDVKSKTVTLPYSDAGTYQYTVKEVPGKVLYYTIRKAPGNKITTSVSSKKYSYKKLRKRSYSFYIGAKALKSGSTRTYKSSSKYVTVSKSGKVTVKKRAKKGTYKVAVTVTNKNYKTVVKYITVRVR